MIEDLQKSAQNILAVAAAFAVITAVMAAAYVLGFEGWTVAASLLVGCGAACAPGAIYTAIENGFDMRRKIGLFACVAPALIVGALYFAGVAPERPGAPKSGERLSAVSAPAISVSPAYAQPRASRDVFAALKQARKARLQRNQRRRRP
jgi:hypothetical protein